MSAYEPNEIEQKWYPFWEKTAIAAFKISRRLAALSTILGIYVSIANDITAPQLIDKHSIIHSF